MTLAVAASAVEVEAARASAEAARYTAAPASSDADADALRLPGRPGSSRARSPISPGFPGARPSPPASGGFLLVPGFPGLPGAGGGAAGGSPAECVAPLAGLMTCGTFLTGSEPETPAPQRNCCTGLGGVLNTTTSSGDGGDRILRCLCQVILGDVNKMLPKPIDPVRLMYLPVGCGIVLPPQALYI